MLRLESGALQNKGRAWAVSHPRMIAVFLARRHTASSYAEIGGWFGGRNHSTAVAAEKKSAPVDAGRRRVGPRRKRAFASARLWSGRSCGRLVSTPISSRQFYCRSRILPSPDRILSTTDH